MKTIDLSGKNIAISRTDSIGDVVLTLPMCAWIKKQFPTAKIIFFCKSYTVAVLKCYPFIDSIVCWDEWEKEDVKSQKRAIKELDIFAFFHVFPNKKLAKRIKCAKVPYRIGTSHRLFHLCTCNIRPHFTRIDSDFHEAQLNFELLRCVGVESLPKMSELVELLNGFSPQESLSPFLVKVLDSNRKKIILHTKSQGSAVEWSLEKYIKLALELINENYVVYFSGTEKEGLQFRSSLPENQYIIDISGKSTLGELITFISKCDVLVACSTGPLHLAAVLGIKTIGLYTELRPMHPERWAPIGRNCEVITLKTRKPKLSDINDIEVESVLREIV